MKWQDVLPAVLRAYRAALPLIGPLLAALVSGLSVAAGLGPYLVAQMC